MTAVKPFYYLPPQAAPVPDDQRDALAAKHRAAVAFLQARGITDPKPVTSVKRPRP